MSNMPSTDNVLIDLTEDEEEEQEQEQGRRFGNVRKELEPSVSSLLDGQHRKKIKLECNPTISTDVTTTQTQMGDDDDDDDDDDDVEIVEPVIPKLAAVTPSEKYKQLNKQRGIGVGVADDDDDVVVEGVLNENRLPHIRQYCTKFPFKMGSYHLKCDMCYCYICDCPVRECNEWNILGLGVRHCIAHDKNRNYQRMRSVVRSSKEKTRMNSTSNMSSNTTTSTTNSVVRAAAAIRFPTTTTTLSRGANCTPPNSSSHPRKSCPIHRFNDKRPNALKDYDLIVMMGNKKFCPSCYCYICMCQASECKNWFTGGRRQPENNHCCSLEDEPRNHRQTGATATGSCTALNTTNTGASRTTTTATTTPPAPAPVAAEGSPLPPKGYHMRECCPRYRFLIRASAVTDNLNRIETISCCSECWCYVCHKQARSCKQWYKHKLGGSNSDNDHCHGHHNSRHWQQERRLCSLSTYGQMGPFAPNHTDARQDETLAQCRHCQWYFRFPEAVKQNNDSSPSRTDTDRKLACSADWCLRCGRVAVEKDLEKNQAIPLTLSRPNSWNEDYFLYATKDIPFTVVAHDPRLFSKYRETWIRLPTYDEEVQQNEVFFHRVGKSPMLKSLLSIMAIRGENGHHNIPNRSDDLLKITDDDTDAILLEKENHYLLFNFLREKVEATGFGKIYIDASWNKSNKSGMLKTKIYLPKKPSVTFLTNNPNVGLTLFGLIHEVFPLALSDIAGSLLEKNGDVRQHFPIESEIGSYRINQLNKSIAGSISKTNAAININQSSFTIVPSDNIKGCNGTFPDSQSKSNLKSNLTRYFLGQLQNMTNEHKGLTSLFSKHQIVNRFNFFSDGSGRPGLEISQLDYLVGFKEAMIAAACYQPDSFSSSRNASIGEIMLRLENIGYHSVDYIDGFKIELLDFQRQSVQWAFEREIVPDGIQSYFWTKLSDATRKDIYFNPLVGLKRGKPRIVRGGYIAEEMGLGKTVISLALILKNPAPENPPSGSPVSILEKKDPFGSSVDSEYKPVWDKVMHMDEITHNNKKRGSIISQGTLVICPVSLVGQWIEEAKSKLKNPGLIYPYHGSNRKRDPQLLASNSIVVTTYDVIASDATHHAKKGGSNYCPPLEQIRWWRIICDEGHSLRHGNTKRSKATFSLCANSKWVVSGTPMNTKINDLKNQLKFIGIEHVDSMFEILQNKYDYDIDALMYLLRPLIIRHSQNQMYKGTKTTLMSLPPKTERTIKIKLSPAERVEYDMIERRAKEFYREFRLENLSTMSKHFFVLSQKLTPLRVASSGGKYPISTGLVTADVDTDTNNGKCTKKREVVYSDFEFQSKFKVLLRELVKIRDNEPDSKSLVFSQYTSTLKWLQLNLAKHGFHYRSLSGDMSMNQRAKALRDFQQDPPTTIFLLSMRAGAVGINLTQANRIFLMEPSFNPALEAQAIGRCHRLGQKRPVETIRLIVEDSIESRMANFIVKKYGSRSAVDSSSSSQLDGDDGDAVMKEENITDEDDTHHSMVDESLPGNLSTDRAKLMVEEFDLLFGVKDSIGGVSSSTADSKLSC